MQPPLAERLPLPHAGTALVGRILIAAIFLLSGSAKLLMPENAIGYMDMAGVPRPDLLVYLAGAAEVLGGLALVLGVLTRLAALGLIAFLVITTLYFHAFWALSGSEAETQMVQFMKNLAIIGGLLVVVATGPGRYSIDGRLTAGSR